MSNEKIMAKNKAHRYDILTLRRFRLLRHIRYKKIKMKKIGT